MITHLSTKIGQIPTLIDFIRGQFPFHVAKRWPISVQQRTGNEGLLPCTSVKTCSLHHVLVIIITPWSTCNTERLEWHMSSLKSSFWCDLSRLVCGSCYNSAQTQIILPAKVVTLSVSVRHVIGLVLDLDLQLDHDKVEGIKPFCRRCVQDVKTLAHLAEIAQRW